MTSPLSHLSFEEKHMLEKYAFDSDQFLSLQQALLAGNFSLEHNRLPENDDITAPRPEDIVTWPAAADTAVYQHLESLGRKAIASGQVAVAILNGGMATRFGGRVKGVVDVIDGLSFLALKLRDIARISPKVEVFLMNSFATLTDTEAHLQAHDWFGLGRDRLHCVNQSISLRLTPTGDLFRDAAGCVSCYAPGHGDLLGALSHSTDFQRFREDGGKFVAISNVDNLAATLSPLVIGVHIFYKKLLTVEVAQRIEKDMGGAPVRRGHRLEILESFRFPRNLSIHSLPFFNTNTFVFHASAIRNDYPLQWFRVDKQVAGQPVVQFERLIGEVTSFVDATYLQVPRAGVQSRFLPVKVPEDLALIRPVVRQLFGL